MAMPVHVTWHLPKIQLHSAPYAFYLSLLVSVARLDSLRSVLVRCPLFVVDDGSNR